MSDPEGYRVASDTVGIARGLGIEAWDPRTDGGTLRSVLVRVDDRGQSELTLVVRRKDRQELHALSRAELPGSSCYLNVNEGDQERLLGWKTEHLRGDARFTLDVAGRTIVLSPAAWMRTSKFLMQKIVELVRELLQPAPDAVVADLYSGSGCLAIAIADLAGQVFGIEENPKAVQDAIANARRNGLEHLRFREGKVEQHLKALEGQRLHAVVLDPPPEGCGRYVINALAKTARPERVIYVSQNPHSFAMEAPFFEDRGFRLTAVHPVDPAPHTSAIEVVALFESSLQGGKRRSSIAQARRLLDRVRRDDT